MQDRAESVENDIKESLFSNDSKLNIVLQTDSRLNRSALEQHKRSVLQNRLRKPSQHQPTMSVLEEFNCQKPLDVYLVTSFDEGGIQRKPGLLICKHESLKLTKDKETLSTNNKSIKYKQSENNKYYYQPFDEEKDYQGNLEEIDTSYQRHGLLSYYSKQEKDFDKIKMLVCVTMYVEERSFLEQTLQHIYQNVEVFKRQADLHESQIVVVVLQDGIMKMKQDTVNFYSDIDDILVRQNHLQNRINIIDQQIEYLKFTGQTATLQSNSGLPNTLPTKTALLYQNQIQFDESNEVDVFKGQSNLRQSNVIHKKGSLTVFSAFKHLNSKKLSSHLWFFEGFCQQFKPKYCALVDVGTLPAKDGLVKFYMAMEGNLNIGGVCGFLGLEEPKEEEPVSQREKEKFEEEMKQKIKGQKYLIRDQWQVEQEQDELNQKIKNNEDNKNDEVKQKQKEKLRESKKERINKRKRKINPLIYIFLLPFTLIYFVFKKILFDSIIYYILLGIFKVIKFILLSFLSLGNLKNAQIYEYTISHMVDKNFESFLGFLHVLPGAWPAYRYQALQIKFEGRESILQKQYLKQLLNPKRLEGNIYEANMFLAEDRILCLGIYCQPQKNYQLKYIPDAYAFTDPVGTLEEIMSQRRRWINSTYFALDYVLKHYRGYVQQSGHTSIQKKILLPFNMLFAALGKFNTYFLPGFYIFVALMCSYQFLNPNIKSGYSLYLRDGSIPYKCQLNIKPDGSQMCNVQDPKYTNCYLSCSIVDNPNFAYTVLNIVPALFIITLLSIIFASLVLKVKGCNKQLLKEIQKECLGVEELDKISKLQNKQKQIEEGEQNNMNENKKQKLLVELDQKIQKVKEKKANKIIKELAEVKLEDVHNLKQTKFDLKKKVDSLVKFSFFQLISLIKKRQQKIFFYYILNFIFNQQKAQEFGITVFKVLSAIITINSLIITAVVLIGVALNVINEKTDIVVGFKVLSPILKWYVIGLLIANVLSYILILIIHLIPQYKLVCFTIYSPVYNHVLLIYAFCNMDDVTWGTKGISKGNEQSEFYLNKVSFVGKWLLLNGLFVTLLISINLFFGSTPYVMLAIGTYGTSYLLIKSIIAMFNYLKYFCCERRRYRKIVENQKQSKAEMQKREKCLKEFSDFRIRS